MGYTRKDPVKHKEYMKVYNQRMRLVREGRSSEVLVDRKQPLPLDGERPYCPCGKQLSLIESLAGRYHTGCRPVKIDVTKYISH